MASDRRWPGAVDLACLHGAQTDWFSSTVVVPAVYREWHGRGPPNWLAEQLPVYLYQRRNASASCYCANRGYESAVYFTFIAQHYARLPRSGRCRLRAGRLDLPDKDGGRRPVPPLAAVLHRRGS